MHKIAVMIYPYFSMQEISFLTDGLIVYYDIDVDVFAASKEIIRSEDNFQVIAEKTFDEFKVEDYECLILPGILNPMPALFDERNIEFLRKLKGKDILISSISSSPMLLAKAGLLENVKFTSGIWDEISQNLDFIPYENVIHQPLVKDKNIITAMGFAFKEFAEETIRTLGIDMCENGIFNGVTGEYCEKELIFKMGDENFKEFMEEYNSYIKWEREEKLNDCEIRNVVIQDAEFLNLLMNHSSVMNALNEVPTQLNDWVEAINYWNEDADEEDYIVFENDNPIGWFAVNGLMSKDVYLKMAVLLPEYQGKHIGSYVLKQIINDLRNKDFHSLSLLTNQDNLKAQKCYKNCGFTIVESLKEQMSDGTWQNRVRMELTWPYM